MYGVSNSKRAKSLLTSLYWGCAWTFDTRIFFRILGGTIIQLVAIIGSDGDEFAQIIRGRFAMGGGQDDLGGNQTPTTPGVAPHPQ